MSGNPRLRSSRGKLSMMATVALAACTTTQSADAPIAGPVSGNTFVIRNVRVFDGSRTIERANVVVRSGTIASVGRSTGSPDLPVIDGDSRTLIPGLIDAHAHIGSATNLRDALRFGVTTALDMLSNISSVRDFKSQRTTSARSDLADLYTAGSPVTSPRGLGTQFGIPFNTITSPDEAPAIVRGRIAEGSDYIKILYEPGAPIFTTISRETLAAVIAAAHAQSVMAVVHVSSLQGARDAVATGADGLAHSFGDTVIDAALAKDMAERGTFVIPTLSIFGAFQGKGVGSQLAADARLAPYLTPAQHKELVKVGPGPDHPLAPYLARFNVDQATRNVRQMHAAGVRILAGTDAPNLGSHGVSLHGELELLVEAGLSPAEALTAATSGPARAFRLPDRGRITAGTRADLVLVDGNPMTDIKATRSIVRIFKNGFEVSRTLPVATR